ncbi:MAG: uridine diphosphate-N-acetylglucosamine-binding protein YvcK [Candidatus Woesearchaeota archaeon]
MRVVCIGGGTGMSLLLTALKTRDIELVAIATSLDSGRSSGSLRDEFGMIAPGDLRNCMIALSDSDEWLKSVLQYRFEQYAPGMNLGNLLFAAIHEMGLDFDEALEQVSQLLRLRGRAYPSTLDPVHIRARLADGTIVEREDRIIERKRAPIESISLSSRARGYPKALEAIRSADLIVVGPGGLYTSVAVHFLIDGFKEAFLESRAHKAYVSNLAVQPHVTDSYSVSDHLEALEAIIEPGCFDTLIVNTQEPPEAVRERYEDAGSDPIIPSHDELESLSERMRLVSGAFLSASVVEEWNKVLTMRHDPAKLASALDSLIHKPLKGLILAAGKGTRMEPFSRSTPKVLLEVCGKPLVAYRIEELLDAGIEDLVIVTNDETTDPIKRYVSEHYPRARVSYALQNDPRGPAHAIDCARDHIRGSRIVLVLADNLSDRPLIPDLIKAASAPGAFGAVAARRVKNPSDFGVARVEDGQVVEILEKPRTPPSNLAVMGTAVLDADVLLERIDKQGYYVRTADGEREISAPQYFTDAHYPLEICISDVRILDVGKPYDLIDAVELLSEGAILGSVAADAHIDERAYIAQSAVIESGARILGASQIEGYVGSNAVVIDSVVMRDARIGDRAHVERSVIGRSATVRSGVRITAKQVPVIINGTATHPGPVGMFVGEGRVVDHADPGRIL